MKRIVLALAALVATTGCHGRYKRNADSLGKVQVVVRAPTSPEVVVNGPSVSADTEDATPAEVAREAAEVGMQVASVVLGAKAQKKLDRAVTTDEAKVALKSSFLSDLDAEALPYKVGEKGRARLTIEITDLGLDASSGTPSAFVRTRTTIHDKTGKKVYRATETCIRTLGPGMDIPMTSADELMAARQLADLSPKKMEKVVMGVVEQCAEEVAMELVTHLN